MAVKRQEGESMGKLADPHAPLLWVRGGVRRVVGDIPPARRPALKGVTKPLLEDSSVRKMVDVRGRIVREDADPRTGDHPYCLSSSGPERSEPWVTVLGKRRRKNRKEVTVNRGGGLPACVSDAPSDSASAGGTVRRDLSYAMATRKTRDRMAVSGRDSRARPKSGARTTGPPKKTARAGTRKRNSAVVMIRCDEGGPSYADVMGEARTGVPLEEYRRY